MIMQFTLLMIGHIICLLFTVRPDQFDYMFYITYEIKFRGWGDRKKIHNTAILLAKKCE